MTLRHLHPWPEPAALDDDGFQAAQDPALVLEAVREVLQGVFPTVTERCLFEAERGNQAVSWARQCGMYLMAGPLAVNVSQTARSWRRDRATVLHAVRLVQRECAERPATCQFISFLEAQTIASLGRLHLHRNEAA